MPMLVRRGLLSSPFFAVWGLEAWRCPVFVRSLYIGVISGLYTDNRKENGITICYLGFRVRVAVSSLSFSLIGWYICKPTDLDPEKPTAQTLRRGLEVAWVWYSSWFYLDIESVSLFWFLLHK